MNTKVNKQYVFILFVEQRYHAYFMEDVDSWMVISAGSFLPFLYLLLIFVMHYVCHEWHNSSTEVV